MSCPQERGLGWVVAVGLTAGLESEHVGSLQGELMGRGRLRRGRTGWHRASGCEGKVQAWALGSRPSPAVLPLGGRGTGLGEGAAALRAAGGHSLSQQRRPHSHGPFSHIDLLLETTHTGCRLWTQTETLTTPLSTQSTQGASKGKGKPDSSWPQLPATCSPRASFLSGNLLSARHPGPLTGDGRTTALTV